MKGIGKYWGIGPRLSIVPGRLLLSSVLPRHSHRTTLTVVALSEINRVYRQVPRSGQSYYSFDSITSHCNDSYEGKPSALNPTALPFRTLLPATMIFTLDRLDRPVFWEARTSQNEAEGKVREPLCASRQSLRYPRSIELAILSLYTSSWIEYRY